MAYPGVDIIEIERFRSAWERQPRLCARLFTARELEELACKGIQSYAARFAGKEAILKALGTGLKGLSWHDVEILCRESGEPYVCLSERGQELLVVRGGTEVRVSLAHNRDQAIALAILE